MRDNHMAHKWSALCYATTASFTCARYEDDACSQNSKKLPIMPN